MFKKFFFLLIVGLSLSFSNYTYALQDDRLDELPFDEEPLEENTKNYFAIAGGATISFKFMNFDDINNFFELKDGWVSLPLEGPVIMTGGTGFTGVPWVPNLRVGVSGMSGQSTINYNLIGDIERKQIDLSYSNFGLNFDYGIVITKSLALLPGIGINASSTILEYTSNTYTSDFDWKKPTEVPNSYISRMESNYITIQPTLNLEWAALDYLAVRVGGGFNYQLSSADWTFNKQNKVTNAPDGIKVSAPYAQIGILVGLFNY